MIGALQSAALRQEAEAVKREWNQGAEPDAREALDRRPELRADKSVAIDLAYDEYCRRSEAGRRPTPTPSATASPATDRPCTG